MGAIAPIPSNPKQSGLPPIFVKAAFFVSCGSAFWWAFDNFIQVRDVKSLYFSWVLLFVMWLSATGFIGGIVWNRTQRKLWVFGVSCMLAAVAVGVNALAPKPLPTTEITDDGSDQPLEWGVVNGDPYVVVNGAHISKLQNEFKLIEFCSLEGFQDSADLPVQKSALYDIHNWPITLNLKIDDEFRKIASTRAKMFIGLLLVPVGVTPDRFSTIRQARVLGAKLLWRGGVAKADAKQNPTLIPQTSQEPLTAAAIASAVAEKTLARDLFAKEIDRPVGSVYLIASLMHHLSSSETTNISGVIEIVDGRDENRPSLFLGFRPDVQEWTEIPGDKQTTLNGIRSEMWTSARTLTSDAHASMLDGMSAFRFDYLDRLESGAAVRTPFKTVRDLDHCSVLIKGTREFLEKLEKVTLVINDFAIFGASRKDIVGWSPPPPPMVARVVQGEIDRATGSLKNSTVVKQSPIVNNLELADGFRNYQFFTAYFSTELAKDPAPLNNAASIDLTRSDISVHRISNGHTAHANASMWILPGEHGWLR